MGYVVKVRFSSGEGITFVSNLETKFSLLEDNEHLTFDWEDEKNHALLKDLSSMSQPWAYDAIYRYGKEVVNFFLFPRREQLLRYVGLSREQASDLALSENLSFRAIMINGVEMEREQTVSQNRVNVYLNNNIVYRAEIF